MRSVVLQTVRYQRVEEQRPHIAPTTTPLLSLPIAGSSIKVSKIALKDVN